MAEDAEDRTEDPTPRRREEARREGRVAFSQEMTGSLILLAAVVGLSSMGSEMGSGLLNVFRTNLSQLLYQDLTSLEVQILFLQLFERTVNIFGMFFLLLVIVAVVSTIAQVGFYLSPEKLEPDIERLNPANGLKKLFSVEALVKVGFSLLKIIALGIIAALVVRSRIGVIASLSDDKLASAAASAWSVVMRMAIYMTAVIAFIGVADYLYKRRQFETSLRMTKQELKEELRQEEGDPLIKSRIRQLQRERARRRMLAQVPTSTVVITNPTHIAVALKYEQGSNSAPTLVAKGTGRTATIISDLARRHSVPIIERPAIAQVLYKTVKEGEEIPQALFRVVAEVIAFVYRLREARV
jgi:flagellar biosynthesis protein FlhB